MSKIVDIYRTDKSGGIAEDPVQIGPRQLAIEAGKITVRIKGHYPGTGLRGFNTKLFPNLLLLFR